MQGKVQLFNSTAGYKAAESFSKGARMCLAIVPVERLSRPKQLYFHQQDLVDVEASDLGYFLVG